MDEKSLEEMMADISVGGTVEEPITVDMSTQELPETVQVVSQSPVKEEVQEMIEQQEENFFVINKDKTMDVLEKDYVKMERSAAIVDAKILKLKEKYKEVFDKLDALEKEKEKALEHKDDYRSLIADKMAEIGEKKWKGMEVEFTYVAATFKKKFNEKRFEQELPNLYAKYVEQTPVRAYIKPKLSLLPVLPEDLKEEL